MDRSRPPLSPYPLPLLLGRVAREWETRRRIFDLPANRFFRGEPDVDLSLDLGGRRPATPVGPAAGPHTQLAQNLALGWLAGARSFELKTVQVLDELEIPRPCIDMETIGYNVEWSQELSLDRSLHEYVKAALLLAILARWEPLREVLGDPGEHLLELSVGYDLAGIRSAALKRFIAGLRDPGPVLKKLRREVPEPFATLRDVPLPVPLIRSATLSTFHGCPPDEIAGIVRHLMEDHDLDVTVKLNPTLLGEDMVHGILHEELGYGEIELVPEAFTEDLAFARATELIEELDDFARARGRIFGIKLTNTLVVANHRGRLPGERMYLSGPPLHVLAVALLDRLQERLGGRLRLGGEDGSVPVAFSAGVRKENLAHLVALGLAPVTFCSDLLKPGGYGRLAPMLRELQRRLRESGCSDLASWRERARSAARAAGRRDAVAAYAARLRTVPGGRPYARETQHPPARRLPVRLQLFDCCSCHLCVTVCPNDAMLRLPRPPALAERLDRKWQYLCLAELCNACGNCETFCPEEGAPFLAKPRLFLRGERFAAAEGQAFLVAADPAAPGGLIVTPSDAAADAAGEVSALLAGEQGWPLRAADLAALERGVEDD
jgi:putative selenate reductase